MSGVLIERGNLDVTYPQEEWHVSKKAEVGAGVPKPRSATGGQQPPEMERGLEPVLAHRLRRNQPCQGLCLDSWPPACQMAGVCCVRCPACGTVTAALANQHPTVRTRGLQAPEEKESPMRVCSGPWAFGRRAESQEVERRARTQPGTPAFEE